MLVLNGPAVLLQIVLNKTQNLIKSQRPVEDLVNYLWWNFLAKKVYSFKPLTISQKISLIDVWQGHMFATK